ncbi:halocyanin [Natronobacterium gregoryi]|nr:halocyanin [Natronobacterium gregoryi]
MSSATGEEESPQVRRIEHDEFDPLGTLALIALYFAILVLLWTFTYFVEFLGNPPTPGVLL